MDECTVLLLLYGNLLSVCFTATYGDNQKFFTSRPFNEIVQVVFHKLPDISEIAKDCV